jgi:enterochelin esterase family protein
MTSASEYTVSAKDAESYGHAEDGEFPLGPDSMLQPGVEPGVLVAGHLDAGAVWPQASHDYWVYTSAGHDASQPADLLLVFDGLECLEDTRLTTVLDNLIARGDLPPIVAVMVAPGSEGPAYPIYGWEMGNRFVEYDVIGPDLPRFVIDELLPVVNKSVALSDDPNRRGAFGGSSCGVAAFTMAWERPDSFRKVLSAIGSFVNIGGAHNYPSMIRRAEPKPIRVYLQAGERDLDTVFGSWPIANRDMAAALAYRGYDHHFVMGDGGHRMYHMAALLPDALRWLWRDRV